VHANGDNGIYVDTRNDAASDLQIQGNQVYDNQTYGIYLYTYYTRASTSKIAVLDNRVHDSGAGIYSYRYYSDLTLKISANEVYNSTEGIYVYNDNGYGHRLEVSDNDVHDNSSRGIYLYSQYGSNNFSPVIAETRCITIPATASSATAATGPIRTWCR
jgi:hypothetical protein